MEKGYIRFQSPLLLHGGLQGFLHHFSEERHEELFHNADYLQGRVLKTDSPLFLKEEFFYFSEKYKHKDGKVYGYLITIEGYPVIVADMSGKEEVNINHLPDELFEI